MRKELEDYDLVVIGGGLSAWVLSSKLAVSHSVLVIEAGSPTSTHAHQRARVQVSKSIESSGPIDIDHASIRADGFGGLANQWNGHVYLATPSDSELEGWPESIRRAVREHEPIARRLMGASRENSGGEEG